MLDGDLCSAYDSILDVEGVMITIEFVEKLKRIKNSDDVNEVNFFDIGGTGYFENPTSDLLALFMGKQRDVPPWLLKTLLSYLDNTLDVDEVDLSSVRVIREARTADGKYLDILITHDDFVIGIENKIYADTYNPFSSYINLINESVNNNQKIYRCILKPDVNLASSIDGWEMINYSCLVRIASQRFGYDVMNNSLNKWAVFYREFLNHLSMLGNSQMNNVSKDNIDFVTDNFSSLIKVTELLDMYQKVITDEAKRVVSTVLPDVNIKSGFNNWKGNYKAIHLTPECWGEGKTGVSLVYRPSIDGDEAEFYVNGWIHSDDYPNLSELKQRVDSQLSTDKFIQTALLDDYDVSLSCNGKLLTLSFWGMTRGKEDALTLLKDMTRYVNECVSH